MNQPSFMSFRVVTFLVAAALGTQCIWLLLAEFSRPGVDRLPTDPQSAPIAAHQRDHAKWAAWLGVIRGDLWAQSAYTYADLIWSNSNNGPNKSLDEARRRIDQAVRYAPHQSGAWLLLAALASRYRWSKPDPAETLKMSYYTGPNQLPLVPLRSLLAAQLATLDDELQLLAGQDLRLLIANQNKPAILQAYQSASPAGKHFMEQVIGDIDPSFGDSLRLGPQ
jgi:hypothetical protein